MNTFDKLCAALAFALGLVFLVLGAFGLFMGCRVNFTLPPVLGAIPAFVGWGIVRAVYCAWTHPVTQRKVNGAETEDTCERR